MVVGMLTGGERDCRDALFSERCMIGTMGPRHSVAIGQLAAELGYNYLALTGSFAQETGMAAQKQGMQPEQVRSWEAGVRVERSSAYASLGYFRAD